MRESFDRLPAQKRKTEQMALTMSSETLARTSKSNFRVWAYEMYGGELWLRVALALGDVPAEMVILVNKYIDGVIKKETGVEATDSITAASERGPPRLSARNVALRAASRGEIERSEVPEIRGNRHKTLESKKARKKARRLSNAIDWHT